MKRTSWRSFGPLGINGLQDVLPLFLWNALWRRRFFQVQD